MINQVEFTNFQGHSYTLLDFSSGLNIIKGRTHSGKSSLMRGILWALENKPRGAGDKYRRDFTKPSEPVCVSIAFAEQTYISREKTGKRNIYLSSEHKDPFSSLRTDVPDEIKEITKLKPHNFQSQKDKYFIISKTPGQVASELNKVVGLKIIDEKSAKMKGILSDLTNRSKVLDSQIKSAKERLDSEEFSNARNINSILSVIDRKVDEYDSESEELLALTETLKEINQHREVVRKYVDMTKIEKLLPKIKSRIKALKGKDEETLEVQETSFMLDSWGAELDQSNKIIALEPSVREINNKLSELHKIKSIITNVRIVEAYIEDDITEAKKCEGDIVEHEARLVELNKELESKSEYCTKCGAHKKHWKKEKL